MKHLPKIVLAATALLPFAASATALENPLGEDDPRAVIANVISVILGLLGAIALLVFIYAGITLMISGGNPEKVKKARNTLVWAIVGLALIFGSYGILNFIFEALAG